jgi:hypothetical protein
MVSKSTLKANHNKVYTWCGQRLYDGQITKAEAAACRAGSQQLMIEIAKTSNIKLPEYGMEGRKRRRR